VEFRDAKAELLASYKDNFDFEEMSKLAIDYSDGVVLAAANVDKQLEQYAIDKHIPVLGYQEDFADAYEDFYNQICPEED
jgi:starch synthase